MAVSFTDLEYGDIAEALLWPRQREWRLPYHDGQLGPATPFVLDGRLSFLDEATKAVALERARTILSRTLETRDDFFDLLPNVTRAGEIYKDERKGYRDKQEVLSDMRDELARIVDFTVNPSCAASGGTRVIG